MTDIELYNYMNNIILEYYNYFKTNNICLCNEPYNFAIGSSTLCCCIGVTNDNNPQIRLKNKKVKLSKENIINNNIELKCYNNITIRLFGNKIYNSDYIDGSYNEEEINIIKTVFDSFKLTEELRKFKLKSFI